MEEQALRDAEQEKEHAIRDAKVSTLVERAREEMKNGQYDEALRQVEAIYALDPGNQEARTLEMKILSARSPQDDAQAMSEQRSAQQESWIREEAQKEQDAVATRDQLRRESFNTYRGMLKQAWISGQPTKEERSMLEVVRMSLGISDEEHTAAEREVQRETYGDALHLAWTSGVLSGDDSSALENLRKLFGICTDEQRAMEAEILSEFRGKGDGF